METDRDRISHWLTFGTFTNSFFSVIFCFLLIRPVNKSHCIWKYKCGKGGPFHLHTMSPDLHSSVPSMYLDWKYIIYLKNTISTLDHFPICIPSCNMYNGTVKILWKSNGKTGQHLMGCTWKQPMKCYLYKYSVLFWAAAMVRLWGDESLKSTCLHKWLQFRGVTKTPVKLSRLTHWSNNGKANDSLMDILYSSWPLG